MATANTRHGERKRVLMKAMIIDGEGTQHATIKDLSSAGAQLSSPRAPRTDRDVVFRRGDVFALARVAWVKGRNYGIEFYRALDSATLSIALSDDPFA